ncbi:unnamed protein product [Symbiodinium pilosum]|uniref:ABM domain-containing protein n=1 Tax=Symbiodinium pilosum TaxID=2952 RepID=A0A812XFB8_SYMPI|nr:unnamed protein product [Symbiodinium pilosum]
MNRYRIREAGEAQFEQRWGGADAALAGMDGFRWFCLLRRVPSTPKSTGALSVVYNYDDEQFEDDYTYITLSVWDSKVQFEAASLAQTPKDADAEGKATFTKMAINGVATVTGPPKSALWDGMLLESKAPDIADSKVFVVMNRFTVKDDCEKEFEQRWAQRESKLQEADGFRFFQLLRRDQTPDDDVNYISMSAWTSRDAFDKWWGSKSFANMAQVQGSLLESATWRSIAVANGRVFAHSTERILSEGKRPSTPYLVGQVGQSAELEGWTSKTQGCSQPVHPSTFAAPTSSSCWVHVLRV